jgi:AcrR family transcriptional regulator
VSSVNRPDAALPDTRRRTERGERSRGAILHAAVRLTTVEGLEGLSIARLADELGISKSGLYAHFRSKEELQLATVETAVELYTEEIVAPVLDLPPGLDRLLTLCDRYFDLIGSSAFPGGCFFVYTALDPALRRPAIRDRLAREQRDWLGYIEELVREAVESGELSAEMDPARLAFELDCVLIGADANYVLLEERHYLDEGRAAVRRLLGVDG